jgi:Ca2+-binding RTX toxin-like protein
MLGSNGADSLTGGAGDDLLVGGAGLDIYQYNPNGGNETIIDSDKKGIILYDPEGQLKALTVGLRQSTNPAGQYKSLDNTITYQVTGADLAITTATGTITVKNFNQNNNDLNIRLITLPTDPVPTDQPPAFVWTSPGDFRQRNGTAFSDRLLRVQEKDSNLDGTPDYAGVDFNGDGVSDNGAFMGLAGAEILHGAGGDDDIDWGGGADRIYGDDGDDFIGDLTFFDLVVGPPYTEAVYEDGGNGRDILEGGWGNDHLVGGPDDASDLLEGSAGDDYLEGGQGNDLLFGNFGHDILDGGAGDDYLYGNGGGWVDRLFVDDPRSPGDATRRVMIIQRDWSFISVDAAIAGTTADAFQFNGIQFTGIQPAEATIAGHIITTDAAGDVLDGGAGRGYRKSSPSWQSGCRCWRRESNVIHSITNQNNPSHGNIFERSAA